MLHTALTKLLKSLAAGRLKYLSPETAKGGKCPPKSPRVKGYPLHQHLYAEIVQPIEGRARLNLGKSSILLNPDTAYLIRPNTAHSERYTAPRRPYQLLWVVFGPGGINFFISDYSATGKFQILPNKIIGQTLNLNGLLHLTGSDNLPQRLTARAEFQALLIQLVLHSLEHMDKITEGSIDHRQILVTQMEEYLKHHFRDPVTVQELAQMARCTPNYLNGIFRKYTGQPIHQFILQKRLEAARILLAGKTESMKQISFQLGFKDPLYFSRLFKKRFGISPSNYLSSISS